MLLPELVRALSGNPVLATAEPLKSRFYGVTSGRTTSASLPAPPLIAPCPSGLVELAGGLSPCPGSLSFHTSGSAPTHCLTSTQSSRFLNPAGTQKALKKYLNECNKKEKNPWL